MNNKHNKLPMSFTPVVDPFIKLCKNCKTKYAIPGNSMDLCEQCDASASGICYMTGMNPLSGITDGLNGPGIKNPKDIVKEVVNVIKMIKK